MQAPKKFETSRLKLNKINLNDVSDIFNNYGQDPIVTKYLSWHNHKNPDDTLKFIIDKTEAWNNGTEHTWTIRAKKDNSFIGSIALRIRGFKADIGYVIARKKWNKGFTTEALKVVFDWIYNQEQIHRVWGFCAVENLASARVMEKVGMKKEATLRNWMLCSADKNPSDCFVFSKVK